MFRQLHLVTCKVALYDRQKQQILLVEYSNGTFGLPGGHLDLNEDPEDAVRRELFEELSVKYDKPLERSDFWIHNNGKVILGFVGELDSRTKMTIDEKELCNVKWASIDAMKNGKISAGSYDNFIMKNFL